MIVTKNFTDLVEYSKCHPKVLDLLKYVDDFISSNFKKDICVTEIYRTVEEQRRLYPRDPSKMSLHMLIPVQAIDLRSWDFTKEEVVALLIAINDNWDFGFPGSSCCIYHKLPSGAYHFHIQACDKTSTKNI